MDVWVRTEIDGWKEGLIDGVHMFECESMCG